MKDEAVNLVRRASRVFVRAGYSGQHRGWAVFVTLDGKEQQVTGWHGGVARAEARMEELQRQARLKQRPCLTCGRPFMSEGIHNRICPKCKITHADKDTSSYAIGRAI